MDSMKNFNFDTIIIGSGQAGLSAAYYLKKADQNFVVLTKDNRVGDNWRKRWDSLKLFTPAFYNNLPGMSFLSEDPDYLPDKNETGDFLETYSKEFKLPIKFNNEVIEIVRDGNLFSIKTKTEIYHTKNVIVAAGAFQTPFIPEFSKDISESVFQIHSSFYKNPNQLKEGNVLVVGAGSSGLQISTEIKNESEIKRIVWLSGPDTGTFPRKLFGIDIYHFLAPTIFKIPTKTFLGKIVKAVSYRHGDLALRPTYKKMIKSGVKRIGRTIGVKNGFPITEKSIPLEIENIIWCTGFKNNFNWIKLNIFNENGFPIHTRGIINKEPGIYFLGLHFQHTISSSLLGGVKKDAEFIINFITNNSGFKNKA